MDNAGTVLKTKRIRLSVRDKLALALLFIMTTLLNADQLIMAAILPELSREFYVTESTLGIIGSAFTFVGAGVGIIFGYLSDKASRKKLMVFLILIGEIPCILTGVPYFTRDIYSFAVLRILSGIGLGGIYPLSYSLLADYFKENNRAVASAWITVAWAIGSILGTSVAGYMTNTFGWRFSFIVIGVPNIPFVLLFALAAKELPRGRTEDVLEKLIEQGLMYKQTIKLSDLHVIFKNKTNILTVLQGIPGTIPWGIMTYWMIAFFQEQRHLSKEMATTVFNVLGVGSILGGLGFAFLGGWLYKKNPRYMPIMCSAGILLGVIPAYFLINMPIDMSGGRQTVSFLALAFFTGALVSVAASNVPAIMMNVNRPEHRGTVFSILNITGNLGQGLGPMLGGMLVPFGYLFMMKFAIMWWVPCGIIFMLVSLSIVRDRDTLIKFLTERAHEMK